MTVTNRRGVNLKVLVVVDDDDPRDAEQLRRIVRAGIEEKLDGACRMLIVYVEDEVPGPYGEL